VADVELVAHVLRGLVHLVQVVAKKAVDELPSQGLSVRRALDGLLDVFGHGVEL